VLWKKVRKQDGAEKLVFPVPNPDGTTDPTAAHVVFSTPSQAQSAVEHLHAHTFKRALLSVTLKKRSDKLPNRSSRLIIRNLSWNVTEQELRALFLPHGPVYSVDIPKEKGEPQNEEDGPSKPRQPKAKGFAFVWMLSRGDAEKALQDVNGKIIGERPIAVDWALSKERWEGEKGRFKEEAKINDIDTDSDRESDSEKDDSDSDEALGEDGQGVHEGDVDFSTESNDEDYVDEDSSDQGEPVEPQLPQTDTGTTIFIRNVPYEATEDELRIL
jgi:nucleolar protein 4